jgi:hypothetical protein
VSALVVYVSSHGFGHAVRTGALLEALRERAGDRLEIHVRSQAPAFLFRRRDPGCHYSAAWLDAGVVQPNGLDIDHVATRAAHLALLAQWDTTLEREARFIRETGAGLVVADVPPLAFAAAARAGVPAVAVANFGWDWVLAPWADEDEALAPVMTRYAEAYALADCLFRLPLHGDFPAFSDVRDVPLLVHRARRPRTETRARLGLAEGNRRSLVLVSFGGLGSGPLKNAHWDDLEGYCFVADTEPPPGFPAAWTRVRDSDGLAHEELVHASDIVLGKPGYGTCAEVLAHGCRFLHLPRLGFREVPVLEAGLTGHPARQMPRSDFYAGRWRAHLDALMTLPEASPLPANGADHIADSLLARLA